MTPRRLLCLSIGVLIFAAVAHADNADIAWNRCAGIVGASDVKSFACDDNDQQFNLAPTFTTDYDLPNFVGVEVSIDVLSELPTLPDWWRFDGLECRMGSATFVSTYPGVGDGTTCKKPWGTGTIGSSTSFTTPVGSQLNRLNIRCRVAQTTPTTLTGGQRYLAGVLELLTNHSYDDQSGATVCAGCQASACLLLQDVILYTGDGSTFSTIHPTTNFLVTYNKAAGAPCVVGTRTSTWGTVKALYR